MPPQIVTSLRLEPHPDRVELVLARPARCNSLDLTCLAELTMILEESASPLPLILRGEGPGFCIGGDIREMADFTASSAEAWSRLGQLAVSALERWPGVTIAHLTGFALGAGLELALGCDVVVGPATVRVGLPGLFLGMMPGFGSLDRLRQRLGADHCRRLFLNGDILDGRQAIEWGLMDRLIRDPQEVIDLAHTLAEFGPSAVQAIRSLRLSQRGAADDLALLFAAPFASGECQRRLRQLLG